MAVTHAEAPASSLRPNSLEQLAARLANLGDSAAASNASVAAATDAMDKTISARAAVSRANCPHGSCLG